MVMAVSTLLVVGAGCDDEGWDPETMYKDAPKCSKTVVSGAKMAADDPFTDVSASKDGVEIGRGLKVGDLMLTAYQGVASRDSYDGEFEGNMPEVRAWSADGEQYVPIPADEVWDVSVSHDGRTAAIALDQGNAKKLGIVDLRDGTLDWLKLPVPAATVEWSPVDRTVAVGTGKPGTALLVKPDDGKVESVSLSSPMDKTAPTYLWWTDKGDGLIATTDEAANPWKAGTHELDGKTKREVPDEAANLHNGASGTSAAVPGLSPSGSLVATSQVAIDVKSGEGVSRLGDAECRHKGVSHTLQPQAWLDDDHLIAVESETPWNDDHGDVDIPDPDKPRGNRLVATDLEGHVTEVITDWETPIPENLWFTRIDH